MPPQPAPAERVDSIYEERLFLLNSSRCLRACCRASRQRSLTEKEKITAALYRGAPGITVGKEATFNMHHLPARIASIGLMAMWMVGPVQAPATQNKPQSTAGPKAIYAAGCVQAGVETGCLVLSNPRN